MPMLSLIGAFLSLFVVSSPPESRMEYGSNIIISRAGIGILTHFARMKRLSFNLCAGATGKQTTVVYAASRGAAWIAKDTTSEGLDTQKETSIFLESWRVGFFAYFFFVPSFFLS